jgi:phage terminase small subunit
LRQLKKLETMQKLNKKQEAFLDELFVNGFNQMKAYQSVYKGVSDETAKTNASRLLSNANVKREYERRQEQNRKRYEVTKEEIVEVVKEIMLNNRKDAPPFSLKAAEILNKMFGFNAADKIELSQNKEQPLFPDVEYDSEND